MQALHSESFQRKFLISYFTLAILVLVFCLAYFERYYINNWFVGCFNFLSKVDSSGFLIFVGVAAGLVYITSAYFFYRAGVFLFGMTFSILQAAIGAIGEISFPSTLHFFLTASTVISGVGFIVFSVLAMAAYEYEIKKREADLSSLSGKDHSHSTDESNQKITKDLNLNLSAKNGSVRLFHSRDDLTLDLRYSQSDVHHSQDQR